MFPSPGIGKASISSQAPASSLHWKTSAAPSKPFLSNSETVLPICPPASKHPAPHFIVFPDRPSPPLPLQTCYMSYRMIQGFLIPSRHANYQRTREQPCHQGTFHVVLCIMEVHQMSVKWIKGVQPWTMHGDTRMLAALTYLQEAQTLFFPWPKCNSFRSTPF